MVAHPRETTRAHRLRPLNQARPIHVEADESGEPRALVLGRERLAVAAVQDRWRIDDEWWRERPVSRAYFTVLLDQECQWTIFQDLVASSWFHQGHG